MSAFLDDFFDAEEEDFWEEDIGELDEKTQEEFKFKENVILKNINLSDFMNLNNHKKKTKIKTELELPKRRERKIHYITREKNEQENSLNPIQRIKFKEKNKQKLSSSDTKEEEKFVWPKGEIKLINPTLQVDDVRVERVKLPNSCQFKNGYIAEVVGNELLMLSIEKRSTKKKYGKFKVFNFKTRKETNLSSKLAKRNEVLVFKDHKLFKYNSSEFFLFRSSELNHIWHLKGFNPKNNHKNLKFYPKCIRRKNLTFPLRIGRLNVEEIAIEPVSNASVVFDGESIFVFGGIGNDNHLTNQFFKLSPENRNQSHSYSNIYNPEDDNYDPNDPTSANSFSNKRIDLFTKEIIIPHLNSYRDFKSTTYIHQPSPRKDHSAIIVESNMFLYGGKNAKGLRLFDFWSFNMKNKTWKKIGDDIFFSPNPRVKEFSFFSSMNGTNHNLFLFGGKNCRTEIPSNYIYKYSEIGNKKNDQKEKKMRKKKQEKMINNYWTPIKLTSKEDAKKIPPIFGHNIIKLTNVSCLVYGGFLESNQANQEIFILKHLDSTDCNIEVFRHLANMKKTGKYTDLELHIPKLPQQSHEEQSQRFEIIKCHKCILASRSFQFDKLLSSQKKQIGTNTTSLKIEGFSKDVVIVYLNFLYTGNIELNFVSGKNQKNNLKEVLEISKKFGGEKLLQKFFSPSHFSVVEVFQEVTSSMIDDFSKLLTPKSLEHSDNYSDLQIKCQQEDGSIVKCHKVFCSRSVFIEKCLNSGMKEEIENTLFFNQLSMKGINEVLMFLYSNEIQPGINHQTALEIHIFALVFKLEKLAQYCRKIISSLMNKENALQLTKIFDLYQDKKLVNLGMRLLSHKYKEVKNDPLFLKLNEDIKYQVFCSFQSLQKQQNKKTKKLKRKKN